MSLCLWVGIPREDTLFLLVALLSDHFSSKLFSFNNKQSRLERGIFLEWIMIFKYFWINITHILISHIVINVYISVPYRSSCYPLTRLCLCCSDNLPYWIAPQLLLLHSWLPYNSNFPHRNGCLSQTHQEA